MTYATIWAISEDEHLRQRVAAAAATQGVDGPRDWAWDNALQLAAQPGWAAAWESALANGVEHPGKDEGVITDGMILAAVQSLLGVV